MDDFTFLRETEIFGLWKSETSWPIFEIFCRMITLRSSFSVQSSVSISPLGGVQCIREILQQPCLPLSSSGVREQVVYRSTDLFKLLFIWLCRDVRKGFLWYKRLPNFLMPCFCTSQKFAHFLTRFRLFHYRYSSVWSRNHTSSSGGEGNFIRKIDSAWFQICNVTGNDPNRSFPLPVLSPYNWKNTYIRSPNGSRYKQIRYRPSIAIRVRPIDW